MLGIYSFYWDCGRNGDLEGIFVADSAKVEAIMGKEVYFGEVLGKHSEIYGTIDEGDITLLTDDQDFITKFIDILGDGTVSGFNPLEQIEDDDDDEDSDEA